MQTPPSTPYVFTASLICLGLVLLALAMMDRLVRRLPLSPAVIYLAIGLAAGALLGAPTAATIKAHAPVLTLYTEAVVLVSLFAVGLRLRLPLAGPAWRVALLMAGPGMLVMVAAAAVAGVAVLGLPWPAALLLAAILAPTDPVLASEVQIRSDQDRDAVRLSLTAEGGLNDGTALPMVMLAMGWLGLHSLGPNGLGWWWADLVWPIGGGALLGLGLGWLLGHALRARVSRGEPVSRDELVYVGAVALAYSLARALQTSTFIVVFAVGAMLLWPFRGAARRHGQDLAERLQSFGARCERLVEAITVLAVGVALYGLEPTFRQLAFGLLLVLVARPLSVLAVVRRGALVRHQRRLVAWFGIRGVGSLFYMALALEHGLESVLAEELLGATLVSIALSIVLHGVSATPLMATYQQRKKVPAVDPIDRAPADGAAQREP
jgi:NhaP-type Na+/H+ or K+/H+ antiporter